MGCSAAGARDTLRLLIFCAGLVMPVRKLLLFAGLLIFTATTSAETPYKRPGGIAELDDALIIAGYRALFTCSAHFFAGRSLDDIKNVELVDVEGYGFPDPVIDASKNTVLAKDTTGDVVQIAAFRDTMGCTLLPPRWDKSDIPRLPYVQYAPAPDQSNTPFPTGDKVGLPSSGIKSRYRGLVDVMDRAFDGETFADVEGVVTYGVIIIKDGEMIAERYRPGFGVHTGYRTWSTAKSISATLMGIAAHKGILDLDGAADIPEWSDPGDPRQAITYKQLLWMSSGLFGGGNNTAAVYFGGQDAISAITTTDLEVEPGTRWKYANNDTLLLLRALRHRLDSDLNYLRFPYDELLHPLGMYHTRMETDYMGNFIGSSQIYTTTRDLARFGIFLANDGVLNGKRLVPEGWVAFSATPAPTKAVVRNERAYGAQFWLLGQYDGVPEGSFTSAGNKGQYVTVVPGHDLVIVRTGVDPNGKRWQQHSFVAAIVEALQR